MSNREISVFLHATFHTQDRWKLIPIDSNRTKLIMEMNMEISGFIGTIMKPMMKMQMNGMGNQLTEEFKFYVENGNPHPRKIKAMK